MKKSFKITTFIIFFLFILGDLYSQKFQFTIETEGDGEYSYFEVEYLKDEQSKLGEIVRFEGSKFQSESIPASTPFFRVRRIGDHEAKGFWSNTFKIADFMKKDIIEIKKPEVPEIAKNDDVFLELEKNGKTILFLNGKSVSIQPKIDSKIKIAETKYRLNNGKWLRYNQDSLKFEKDGEYQMDYYSIDILGNREETQSVIFLVDNIPPKSKIQVPQFKHQSNERAYVAGSVNLSIDSYDEVSGVDKVYYKLECINGKSSGFMEYENPIPIKEISQYCNSDLILEYYAVDKVGNQESKKSILIKYGK
ncbi:MAG: hypothetical protein JJT78_03130 [Leptospira sp.]|nr:hypothetical protein [Leptospira sp.]